MIKIIYGGKGTGKTKRIIDVANERGVNSPGDVIYLTDNSRHVSEVKYVIRYIDTTEYGICDENGLLGFIRGLLAGNYDIKEIFIDGAVRMMNNNIEDMSHFMDELKSISEKSEVNFTLTISRDLEEIPDFFKQYID